MTQEARSAATGRKKIPTVAAKSGGHSSAANTAAFQHYQAAVQLVQQGKFDKALAAFEKIVPTAPFEIIERCGVQTAFGDDIDNALANRG